MQSMTVIKHHNIIQNILPGFFSSLIVSPSCSLFFQAAKEAFRNTIIPTITFAIHAAKKIRSVLVTSDTRC
jgi:hypothetical protein